MLSTFIKLPFVIKIFILSILVAVLHRFYCSPLPTYEHVKVRAAMYNSVK